MPICVSFVHCCESVAVDEEEGGVSKRNENRFKDKDVRLCAWEVFASSESAFDIAIECACVLVGKQMRLSLEGRWESYAGTPYPIFPGGAVTIIGFFPTERGRRKIHSGLNLVGCPKPQANACAVCGHR
jgi:hypothetical protein